MKLILGHAGHIKLLLICLIAGIFTLSAGNPSDSVTVYFRTSHSVIDGNYRGNAASMDKFIDRLRMSQDAVDSIIISGYVSPDGHRLGDPLPLRRCDAVAQYIIQHAGINPDLLTFRPVGVDWSLLRRLIADTPDVPYRQQLLSTIDKYPEWISDSKGRVVDGRNKRLMEIAGGRPYHWLKDNIFPDLRSAVAVTVKWQLPVAPEPPQAPQATDSLKTLEPLEPLKTLEPLDSLQTLEPADSLQTLEPADSLQTDSIEVIEPSKRHFYMAAKTNMLYDAALVPNLAAEFYLGKNLSAYGDWMYAWWDSFERHKFWRIYGGDLGVRWWFGKKAHEKPLTGHHLGIFAGVVTFDFELGDHGYMGGKPGGTLWDRCLVNTGIEYGYSLPVAKRLNIDFSIAIGYLGGNYIKYFPFDNEYFKEKEYKMRFVGPTKAEVSLVWLIGRGNVNRKGGAQ